MDRLIDLVELRGRATQATSGAILGMACNRSVGVQTSLLDPSHETCSRRNLGRVGLDRIEYQQNLVEFADRKCLR